MSTENARNSHLQELGGSNYEIAEGQPDIRGWDVKDQSGKKIGKVKELLFDEPSRKVRYIVTKINGKDDNAEDKKVLVPIGVGQLDENDDDVLLPGVSLDQLQSLPEYDEDNFDIDTEHRIRNVFAGLGGAAVAGGALTSDRDEFYNHNHFNEDNLYKNRSEKDTGTIPVIQEELQVGKREVATGGIRLKSRIIENQVQEDINLREERVHVERTPVDRPATAADIREKNIELTETAEVPVVNKETRVVEEISLNKEVTEKEERVSDTVRSTEVDIDRTGEDNTFNKGSRNL